MIPFAIEQTVIHLLNKKPTKAILTQEVSLGDKLYKIWEVTLEDNSVEKLIQFKAVSKEPTIGGEVTMLATEERLRQIFDSDDRPT
jgi:hypothetical protein